MKAISHISILAALFFAVWVFAAEPTVTSEELTPEVPAALPPATVSAEPIPPSETAPAPVAVSTVPTPAATPAVAPAPTPAVASAESATFPAGSEIAVILAKDRFYPNQIRMRAGVPAALVFTTVNKKPAALVLEPISIQRTLASHASPSIDRATAPTEITRELNADRVTTISFEPVKGKYGFHDALSGARGEIIVE